MMKLNWSDTYRVCIKIEVIGRRRIHRAAYWVKQYAEYRLTKGYVVDKEVSHREKSSSYLQAYQMHHMVPKWEISWLEKYTRSRLKRYLQVRKYQWNLACPNTYCTLDFWNGDWPGVPWPEICCKGHKSFGDFLRRKVCRIQDGSWIVWFAT